MALNIFLFILGIVVAALTLRDVFQTVIVPGEARSSLQVARRLIRLLVPVWKLGRGRRQGISGTFAPTVLVLSFIIWLALLMIGYGCMTYAVRAHFQPVIGSFFEAIYVVGSSLVTVGLSNENATGIARWIILPAGFSGMAVVTMAVTYLLQVQSSVTQRDTGIIKLNTVAGEPASAVTLLSRFAAIDNRDELGSTLRAGRDWCATVRQTHVTHPTLIYFQSIGSDSGWPAALGALLDLGLLVEFFLDEPALFGPAVLLRAEGEKMARELAKSAEVKPKPVEANEPLLRQAYERLELAGYTMRKEPDFASVARYRSEYRSCVDALADHLGKPTAELVRQD